MTDEKKINSLIYLLEDPDEEIYGEVKNNLLSMGEVIIPKLEYAAKFSENISVQRRLEEILHTLHFTQIVAAFTNWAEKPQHSLAEGLAIICSTYFHQLDSKRFISDLQLLKKEIWLELSHQYLPNKSILQFNKVFFQQRQFSIAEMPCETKYCFINELLYSKKGHPLALSLLYGLQAALLDMPMYMIAFPEEIILLAFTEQSFLPERPENAFGNSLDFFINPAQSGAIGNQAGIESFLRKNNFDSDIYSYPILCYAGAIKIYLQFLKHHFSINADLVRANDMDVLQNILVSFHPNV